MTVQTFSTKIDFSFKAKSHVAVFTLIRFLSSVLSKVNFECPSCAKTLITINTFKWSLRGVKHHVIFQHELILQHFVAYFTFFRSFLVMSQTVLFKGGYVMECFIAFRTVECIVGFHVYT